MKTARVGDLAIQVRGVTFAKADASTEQRSGTVGVVRAGNIVDGELDTGDLVFVPASKVSEKQMLRRHDVLIAASSGSLDVVGKAARVREDQLVAFGAFCKVLRPSTKVDPGYFSHYFQTVEYRRHVSAVAAGANINNLKNSDLDDIEIPLPPLEEQRRIASILDTADALRTKRRQALEKLDSLSQSIFIDIFGDLNSAGNEVVKTTLTLGELTAERPICYGVLKPGPHVDGGVPLVRIVDLIDRGVAADRLHRISRSLDSEFRRSRLVGGEVLLSIQGTIGRVAVCPPELAGANISRTIARIAPDQRVHPEFLAEWLRLQQQFRTSGSTRESLNIGAIRKMVVPIPTEDAQRRFVECLAALTADRRSQIESARLMELMWASLQHRAFRGEL